MINLITVLGLTCDNIHSEISLNVGALCAYLLSCFEADPPHKSLLCVPAGDQSDHLLLGCQGTVLSAALHLAALLQQGNLLLAQEVLGRASRRCYNLLEKRSGRRDFT